MTWIFPFLYVINDLITLYRAKKDRIHYAYCLFAMIPNSCRPTRATLTFHSKRYIHKQFQFIKREKTRDTAITEASLAVNYGNLMNIRDFFIEHQCNAFPISHDVNKPSSKNLKGKKNYSVDTLFSQINYIKEHYGISEPVDDKYSTKSDPAESLKDSILVLFKNIIRSSSLKKNEELYNFLVDVRHKDPESFEYLIINLSSFEVSILLKRLVEYNSYVNRFYTSELRFSSRLNKSDKISKGLLKTKDTIFLNIYKIIRNIQRFSNYELPLSKDYEQLIKFQLESQKQKAAYTIMKEFDSFVKQGKKNYHITKGIIDDKLKLLGNADVSTWKIGRYSVKKVNPGNFSRNVKHKSIEYFYRFFPVNNVLIDIDILNSIILNLGYSKDTQLLESFIHNSFGIEYIERVDENDNNISSSHYNPSPDFVKPSKGSLTYPNVTTLSNILYSYNYNNELSKGILIVNEIMTNYSFDKYDLPKFYTSLITNVGLLSKNTKRDLTTELWKRGASNLEINQEFNLQYILIALISQNLATTSQSIYDNNSYISKNLLKVKMTFSSVQGLLNELPIVHSKLSSFINSTNLYNQRYDYNLLMSYLNIIIIRLSSLNLYYDADKIIQQFSIDHNMKNILRKNLKKFQSRYLKSHKHELIDRENDNDFDDSYEEFDGFDTNQTIAYGINKSNDTFSPESTSTAKPKKKTKIKKKVDDYDDEDSVLGLW